MNLNAGGCPEEVFSREHSVRVEVSQNVWFLQPVCEHQLLVTKKLMRWAIGDDQSLIEHDCS